MSDLTQFYSGHGKTNDGFTFDDVLAASNEEWESCHSFIQWIFPLKESSAFNENAPILSQLDQLDFWNAAILRKNVETMFVRTLDFFFPQDMEEIIKPNWVVKTDHNHLRITRIISSLRLLGFDNLSITFFNRVMKVVDMYPDTISSTSIEFWQNARK